jgi:signal transduction histidine kinase/ABC-type uncharacterized transport system substrate-binding protein
MRPSCRLWLAVIAFLLVAAPEPVAAGGKRVLLLHSFGQDFRPWSDYARTIRSELQRQSPWPLDITDHSLVTARFRSEDPEIPFIAYLRALLTEQKPDLIVSIGAPAAAFVQRHRPQLFADTPMVFTAVEQRRVQYSTLTENDTVVAVAADFAPILENILRVLPDTETVAIVNGASPNELFWREEMRKEVKPFADRLTFIWYDEDLSFEDILRKAASLPPRSAIYWNLMNVDAAGVSHEGGRALAQLHAIANAPIFSYDESYFGRAIVGGPLLTVLDSSRQTAAVAVRILGGERAGDIKMPAVTYAMPKFDWREMQRWGISASRLPLGSEIVFRGPTVWERYRWQIISILLALLVLSAMVTWLLVERLERRRAETRSRKLSLEVIHLNRAAEVGALSASFAHDLGQPTLSIALNAQRVEHLLSRDRPELGKIKEAVIDISRANDHAAAIIKQFGKLLKRSSDPEIQPEIDLNVVIADALSILSTEANHRQVVLLAESHKGPLLVKVDPVHILQLVLNLATNAMDAMADIPPDARRVTIRTEVHGCKVEVVVSDTGPGIPEHMIDEIFDTFYTTKPHGTGLGLSIARTIVEAYRGKIWAKNGAEGGAAFHFMIPLSADVTGQRETTRQRSTREPAVA